MGEITKAGPLLNRDGSLSASGWARQPLLDANLECVKVCSLKPWQKLRIKRWQYFGITTPTHFFSFTISDIGYIGSIFAYVLEFATREYHEQTLTVPLAEGVTLPRTSTSGDCHYEKGGLRLHFFIKNDRERILDINWPGFGGRGLKAGLELVLQPGHESVVNVFPFDNRRFFYTRKVNCLPAGGTIEYGKNYEIQPASCLGTLDWGVGVWPYRSFWIWGSASGFLPGGGTLGLNLGGGIGNHPEVNDNALILDGIVHKLGIVDYKYDTGDFMQPWTIKEREGRLDLVFTPFFERVARTDFKILSSEVHQIFGRYNGFVVADDGEKMDIRDLIGWCEEHRAKW